VKAADFLPLYIIMFTKVVTKVSPKRGSGAITRGFGFLFLILVDLYGGLEEMLDFRR